MLLGRFFDREVAWAARLVFRVDVLSTTMASKTRLDARGAGNLNPCNSPPQF